ncbi:MAG TPA: cupin domain-containing protein [Solirubrobacteraceae bacterium]|jgi:mannose-6-phosphate isomerase-like protein (cupin superfamily)|nr:cupin domain-containing protein [Solirubrobacteraceae bacterium]
MSYGIARSPGEPAPPLAPGRPPEDGVVDRERYPRVQVGEGYALGCIDDFEEGYGFRKVRSGLGVSAFGVNVLVRPPGHETKRHYHERQQELYFVHSGSIEMRFGDGSSHVLWPGCFARVDAATVRQIKVLGPGETVYLCVGGSDGYIGHDGCSAEE